MLVRASVCIYLQVLETILEAPLSRVSSVLTTLVLLILLLVSTAATLAEIAITNAEFPEFNVTCSLIYIIGIFVILFTFLRKTDWYRKRTAKERMVTMKRYQLSDNVIAEIILYPAIVCSLMRTITRGSFSLNIFTNLDYTNQMVRI